MRFCHLAFVLFIMLGHLNDTKQSEILQAHWFNQIVRFIFSFNDMAIDTIVLTSHHEECGRSILCNSLWKILFEAHLMVWSPNGYIPFLKISHEVDNMTKSSINSVNNLFVVTYDENNTNIFTSQSSGSFSENSWLLLLDNERIVTN